MKTIILFFTFWIQSFTGAAQFTVEWDDANIVGTVSFEVYAQRPGGIFERQVKGLLVKEFTFTDQEPGPISIYVKAISSDGVMETGPSNIINLTVPSAPGNLRTRVRIALQSSGDMETWKTVATVPVPEADRAFYRLTFAN